MDNIMSNEHLCEQIYIIPQKDDLIKLFNGTAYTVIYYGRTGSASDHYGNCDEWIIKLRCLIRMESQELRLAVSCWGQISTSHVLSFVSKNGVVAYGLPYLSSDERRWLVRNGYVGYALTLIEREPGAVEDMDVDEPNASDANQTVETQPVADPERRAVNGEDTAESDSREPHGNQEV
jgi:hypothetical protein